MIGRCIVLGALTALWGTGIGCVPTTGSGNDDDDGGGGAPDVATTDGGATDGDPSDPDDMGPDPDGDGPFDMTRPDDGLSDPDSTVSPDMAITDMAPTPDTGPDPDGGPEPDRGPAGRPEDCNGDDDDLDGRVDEDTLCPASRIAEPGETRPLDGRLNETNPVWQRLDEACGVRTQGDFWYVARRIVNDGRLDRRLEITVDWGDVDGFLFVFGDPFDADAAEGCLAADDDDGDTSRSRIWPQAIAAGQVLTIVATTYDPETAHPGFTLRVRTVPDTEGVCDDGEDDDLDGAVDCADPDCVDSAVCDPCFGVECPAGARCDEGACVDFATPLPPVGQSVSFDGLLPPGSPTYDRPTENCSPTGATVPYAALPLVNRTGAPRMVQIDADWFDDDGFLSLFGDPFDPDEADTCLANDDLFERQRDRSRIGQIRIEPDEVVWVVPSGGREGQPLARYAVDVTTLEADPGVESICDDEVDDDRDGSASCADWDCAAAPECQPCADVVCGGGDRCVDGECTPVGGEPIVVGFAGETIVVQGALDASDPQWTRPSEACVAGDEAGQYYEVVRLVTPRDFFMDITLTAEWEGGDGFLHIYTDPFDPNRLDGCLAGNDDDGGVDRSRIDDFALDRNQVVTVVLSTFGVRRTVPRYVLRITSEPGG